MGGSSSNLKLKQEEVWRERQRHMNMTPEQRLESRPPGSPAPVNPDGLKTWTEYYRDNIDMEEYISPQHQRYPAHETFNRKIYLWLGDITSLQVDAIVNCADAGTNPEKTASAVSRRITEKAGAYYKAECRLNWTEEPGQAMVTGAYNLTSTYVFNTLLAKSRDQTAVRNCYTSCLMKARHIMVKSIAFPCIVNGTSSKKNAVTRDGAALLGAIAAREWLKENHRHIDRIIFCVDNVEEHRCYTQILQEVFPVNLSLAFSSVHREALDYKLDRRQDPATELPRGLSSKEAFQRLVGGNNGSLLQHEPLTESTDVDPTSSNPPTEPDNRSTIISGGDSLQPGGLVGKRSPDQSNDSLQTEDSLVQSNGSLESRDSLIQSNGSVHTDDALDQPKEEATNDSTSTDDTTTQDEDQNNTTGSGVTLRKPRRIVTLMPGRHHNATSNVSQSTISSGPEPNLDDQSQAAFKRIVGGKHVTGVPNDMTMATNDDTTLHRKTMT